MKTTNLAFSVGITVVAVTLVLILVLSAAAPALSATPAPGEVIPIKSMVGLTSLNATTSLDDMSPISLLNMLTSSDVARGKLVGDETLNGTAVKRYVINGQAFLAAAQESFLAGDQYAYSLHGRHPCRAARRGPGILYLPQG